MRRAAGRPLVRASLLLLAALTAIFLLLTLAGPILMLAGPILAQRAGLALTNTADSTLTNSGQQITFTISETNNANLPLPVAVRNTLPGNVTFVSATPNKGTCFPPGTFFFLSANDVFCLLGILPSGQSATIDTVVTPTEPGIVVNEARDGFGLGNHAWAAVVVLPEQVPIPHLSIPRLSASTGSGILHRLPFVYLRGKQPSL